MSTKDISRFLHQPKKHYAGVRMQQGRVLLDSDFNEGARLHEDERRLAVVDLVGSQGSPDDGFSIGWLDESVAPSVVRPLKAPLTLDPDAISFNGGPDTLVIPYRVRPGAFYVGGMRVTMEVPEHIAFQRDFLPAGPGDMPLVVEEEDFRFAHLLYLHAWEQAVTAVEDEEILERALGGPDTSVRVRRMRRVETLPLVVNIGGTGLDCVSVWNRLIATLEDPNAEFDRRTGELVSKGRLQLTFQTGAVDDTCAACDPVPGSQFLGAENQAIRIMLTSAGSATTPGTYVWAFDNSAPLYRVEITGLEVDTPSTPVTVKMLTTPKDEEHFPQPNRVIELLPWSAILDNGEKVAAEVGVFARVLTGYDAAEKTFTLERETARIHAIRDLVHQWDDQHPEQGKLNGTARLFYARFWHEAPTQAQIEIPTNAQTTTGSPQPLSRTGIEPRFHAPGRRGDFWTAAFRPETPNEIIPRELQDAEGIRPHGPRHFYAPLARVRGIFQVGGDSFQAVIEDVEDLRARLRKVTNIGCCTVTVGDGVCSIGEFTSIQDAIDALPATGGKVCIRPGTYEETVVIDNRNNIVLEGCGPNTVLRAVPSFSPALVALTISRSGTITVRGLALEARLTAVINVQQSTQVHLSDLEARIAIDGDVIDPAFEQASVPFVICNETNGLTMRSLRIGGAPRTSILLTRVENASLDDLTLEGAQRGDAVPMDALLEIGESSDVVVRGSRISAFGQVGVLLTGNPTPLEDSEIEPNRNVVLEGLAISTGPHPADAPSELGGHVQARSAIDVQGGQRIRVAGNTCTMDPTLSEHALVVIEGTDIEVDDNRLECLFPVDPSPDDEEDPFPPLQVASWGGLQVRGLSTNVQVRRNHILRGLGHGITLGSAVWAPAAQRPQSVRFGAGHGQITADFLSETDLTAVLWRVTAASAAEGGNVARDQGPIEDIVISANHIEFMSTNGISVLTQFWSQTDEDFIELKSARIENNRISNNVSDPSDRIGLLEDVMPTTSTVFDLEPGRGPTTNLVQQDLRVLQLGGIVLAAATGRLDIHDNVIERNGASSVRTSEAGTPIPNNVPVSGIFVLVGDEIVIADNRVVDNGTLLPSSDTFLLPGIRAGIAVMLAGVGRADRGVFFGVQANPQLPDVSGSSLRVINNVVLQPEGRALFVTGTGPLVVEANFLGSKGNHGAPRVEEELAIGDVVLVQNLGQPWEASDFSLGGFRFPARAPDYLGATGSTATPSPLVLFFVGDGGAVQFNNNQVTYNWLVEQRPESPPFSPIGVGFRLSFYSVAILSLDHATVTNNQMAMRVRFADGVEPGTLTTQFVSHLLVGGGTVDVRGNRVAESVDDTELSILTMGLLLNTTSFNQGTHCIAAYSPPDSPEYRAVQSNLTLAAPATTNTVAASCAALSNTFVPTANAFFALMNAIGDRTPRP